MPGTRSGFLKMTENNKQADRTWLWLSAIFVCALALRLVYLSQASDCPLLFYPGLDPQAYDQWAQKIADGNWLGDRIFYQSPLYPYYLGIFYALLGRRLVWVYVSQILIGSIDCLIVYGIGNKVFGKRVGLMAGFFAAAYKPFIFYDSMLLKTFLEVFLIDLSILLTLAAAENGKRRTGFFAGLALGLGTLARDNFLLMVFWFAPWLFARLRGKNQGGHAVFFLAGFALVIAVCAARNLAVGRDMVLTTSQAGQNFYIGNHRGNLTGTYVAPDFVTANPFFEETDFYKEAVKRTGRMLMLPSAVSNFWFQETFKEIRADRALFLERVGLKLLLFWNFKEIADNVSYYLFKKDFSWLLRTPLLEFGYIAPFALLGLTLALRRRKGMLLAGYVIIYWLSVSMFFIFARYRLVVMGPFLVLAGYGIENIYFWVKDKKRRQTGLALLLLALFFLLVWRPLVYRPLIKETLDYAYYNLGNSYARAGKYKQAITAYQNAISENPDRVDFWINLGKAREYTGDNQGAWRDYSRAARMAPGKASAHLNLGMILYKLGDYQASRAEMERALELEPGLKDAKMYLKMLDQKKPG